MGLTQSLDVYLICSSYLKTSRWKVLIVFLEKDNHTLLEIKLDVTYRSLWLGLLLIESKSMTNLLHFGLNSLKKKKMKRETGIR